VIEHILSVSDDPSDHLNPVMLEHAEDEPTNCATYQGLNSEFSDLLNPSDGVPLGEDRFLQLYVSLPILPGHYDRVRTVQPVRHAIVHPNDADRFHGFHRLRFDDL
jgi:hypothetical protein